MAELINPRCSKVRAMISDSPEIAIPKLARYIRSQIDNLLYPIQSFKIGRTSDPIGRQKDYLAKGYGFYNPIYGNRNSSSVSQVESELIDIFFKHPKCENRVASSQGGKAEESQGHYVYLAIRYPVSRFKF